MAPGLPVAPAEAWFSTNSQRILVVDDDAIRAMVARVLQREKFTVDSAGDGDLIACVRDLLPSPPEIA